MVVAIYIENRLKANRELLIRIMPKLLRKFSLKQRIN